MKVTKTFQYGDREFKLETGEIARQADACVIASCGDTQVMVSVVSNCLLYTSPSPRDRG